MGPERPEMRRTTAFRQVFGIFEGGGVNVAALAGASNRAVERGVNYSGVAGTSGGAILASFIAAGMRPEQIQQTLANAPYRSFQKKAPRHPMVARHWMGAISWATGKNSAIRTLHRVGLYSTAPLEAWIETSLRGILGITEVVRFKDLPLPLYVVATDLLAGTFKIWSTVDTPDDGVSMAVRASSTVPFVFQPHIDTQAIYVDGGVLSNFPVHLILPKAQQHSPSDPVLGFRLQYENDHPHSLEPHSRKFLLRRFVETIVGGHTAVQLATGEPIDIVTVRVKGSDATDFGGMTPERQKDLVTKGEAAVDAFLDNETLVLSARQRDAGRREIRSVGQYFDVLRSMLDAARDLIVVSTAEKDWIFDLAVSLIAARTRGVQVHVAYLSTETPPTQRLGFLRALGCKVQVHTPDKTAFRGVIIDPTHARRARMIVPVRHTEEHGVLAQSYLAPFDTVVIERSYASAAILVSDAEGNGHAPSFSKYDEAELFRRLKTIPFYTHAGLDLDSVEIEKTKPQASYVRRFKLNQAHVLNRVFAENGWKHYESIGATLSSGRSTIIAPPVLEAHGPDLYVAEGHSRLFLARLLGIGSVRCVVVSGVKDPLPSKPFGDWRKVKVALQPPDQQDNGYARRDPQLKRSIESAVHLASDWE